MAVFLINSRLGLLCATLNLIKKGSHFFRSYMCILPSSLTRDRSCALDYSSFLPVSVCGTVLNILALDSISWHLDYFHFASTFSPLAVTTHLNIRICLYISSTRRFDRVNRRPAGFHLMRPALEYIKGSGLWTGFPSTTTFVLALGADLPWEDCLYSGNLRFSADGNLTRLCVTYTCILSSYISNIPRSTSSST